jgi:hypothetical protein
MSLVWFRYDLQLLLLNFFSVFRTKLQSRAMVARWARASEGLAALWRDFGMMNTLPNLTTAMKCTFQQQKIEKIDNSNGNSRGGILEFREVRIR